MAWEQLQRVRAESPLVHNVTNYVVMNSTANALLALGASPVMAHAEEEVEEMVGLARALVLNLGTLSAPWIEAMALAGAAARRRGIPIVLDPVGAGATRMRTAAALRLLDATAPTVVRANASEVRALAFAEPGTKGVDSSADAAASLDAARALAKRHGCIVSMSGATDFIVDGATVARVGNGHPMMARVTGMGCTASALTGAFLAVVPLQGARPSARFDGAVAAMVVNGIAGEIAGERAAGPGSFQVHFLDALAALQEADLARRAQVARA